MGQQNIAVLGGGLVGGYIARELARSLGGKASVTLCDLSQAALERTYDLAAGMGHPISINQADLSDREVLLKSIEDARLVIGALPGHLGYECLKTVIEAGRDCVDISFCPEDLLALDPLAQPEPLQLRYVRRLFRQDPRREARHPQRDAGAGGRPAAGLCGAAGALA